jgi:hypothetical protein
MIPEKRKRVNDIYEARCSTKPYSVAYRYYLRGIIRKETGYGSGRTTF